MTSTAPGDTVTHPIDAELFRRTAPAWNCVGYPGDGMHYTPRSDAGCAWCGKKRAQIDDERREREAAREAGND